MAQTAEAPKWVGKASAKVPGVLADTVWALLQDFGALYKWIPNLDSSEIIEGELGQLGCVRLNAGPPIPGSEVGSHSKEKLIAMDPVQRSLSYQVLDNNIGFNYYVGTITVSPDGDDACTIDWSFEAEPMLAWTHEQIVEYVGLEVETMAKRMAEALKAE
ncbi:lachrymatory-factor synthase-like [Aristolochia californica]|uniref:lachrymatory-factor synthase-like n=1 Tax=Aristolochia californica TaxID=171875 RepID=UPI0035D6E97C